MKKSIPKKLALKPETVRQLRASDLDAAVGGLPRNSDFCSASCPISIISQCFFCD
jgi:hypothetical protein